MLPRLALARLVTLLGEFPAVCILGPRQVGKTTLALDCADQLSPDCVYLDLEAPSDLAKLSEPELFLDAHADKLVILDEVQRVPGLFKVLRGAIDQRRRKGRRTRQFLLLGSATGELLAQSAESLAGRLAYMELPPLLATETQSVPGTREERQWLRGGFPDSLLATSEAASLRWRQQFIATYLERDIPALGPRIPAQTLRRLWTMLAHEQGQLLNASKLSASLAISGQTVARYIDLLSDLMLVRRLAPWADNVGKRLVRAPKVYVRDSGIVHALLGLPSRDALLGHPVVGGSWEGWVIENLIGSAPPGTHASFFRTSAGAEIDLVLDMPQGQRWAIEIKRSKAPVPTKGFYNALEDIRPHIVYVAYPGSDSYPLSDHVQVAPLLEIMAALGRVETRA